MDVRDADCAAEEESRALLAALDPGEFTQLLIATREGDTASWSDLLRLVYGDLRRLARRHVLTAADASTLGATGLINECYLRLFGQAQATVANRRHFFYLASRVMRQVLCDYAREQLSEKRGGSQRREELSVVDAETFAETDRMVVIDDALRALEHENARLARVFECRYFAGLSDEEVAETLGISLRTAQRDWKQARIWLAERLS
ncbi:MAG TPA: ECF-type sigma factor [Rhodanobacteraceae bacterium]|nr:ECF-type sigma factor [Rhodanobacteraceae bacterium]